MDGIPSGVRDDCRPPFAHGPQTAVVRRVSQHRTTGVRRSRAGHRTTVVRRSLAWPVGTSAPPSSCPSRVRGRSHQPRPARWRLFARDVPTGQTAPQACQRRSAPGPRVRADLHQQRRQHAPRRATEPHSHRALQRRAHRRAGFCVLVAAPTHVAPPSISHSGHHLGGAGSGSSPPGGEWLRTRRSRPREGGDTGMDDRCDRAAGGGDAAGSTHTMRSPGVNVVTPSRVVAVPPPASTAAATSAVGVNVLRFTSARGDGVASTRQQGYRPETAHTGGVPAFAADILRTFGLCRHQRRPGGTPRIPLYERDSG